jgi:hypothetical protein
MVALGLRFVNLALNQCVTGLNVYAVSMMNSYLWDKPLIPCGIRQTHPMRPA